MSSSPARRETHPTADTGPVVDTRRSPHCRLRSVPLGHVHLDDEFWAPRLRTTQRVTLRQQYDQCEQTGRIDNFRRAAGKRQIDFQGRFYNDSDVYKWLEAASYALTLRPDGERDRELAQIVDGVIDEIAAAQAPDGYLNTYFTFERAAERWDNLDVMHQLYCTGHLVQAAVAHHRATGEATLLDAATRLADCICREFGPQGRPGADGHEEIEMALVELYRETGRRVYLDQASFFLDQRGRGLLKRGAYVQDHLPVREQAEIVGHAVRATYLACGMADVAAETGEPALAEAVDRLWQSAFTRKAYVTGGLGARHEGESFGADYELPNERAYAETCAAVGGLMWNWRLLLRTGEARFADWLETALYNGILSGISLDGAEYFYQNPLTDRGGHRRQPWFGTACCPPNIARLLLSLPGYVAATSDGALWLHLYAAGTVRTTLPDGAPVALRVKTRYPWEGDVQIILEQAPADPFALLLRVPAWAAGATVELNGSSVAGAPPLPRPSPPLHRVERGPGGEVASTYVQLHRSWRSGDVVDLHLPLPVRQLVSHPWVQANTGRVALARGPLVYCVEGADHPGVDVWDLELSAATRFAAEAAPDLLGGVVVLRGPAAAAPSTWDGHLYLPEPEQPAPGRRPVTLTAIPYYAWANRAPGPMQVWLRRGPASR